MPISNTTLTCFIKLSLHFKTNFNWWPQFFGPSGGLLKCRDNCLFFNKVYLHGEGTILLVCAVWSQARQGGRRLPLPQPQSCSLADNRHSVGSPPTAEDSGDCPGSLQPTENMSFLWINRMSIKVTHYISPLLNKLRTYGHIREVAIGAPKGN